MFIAVNERWSRTYVTDAPGSVTNFFAERAQDQGYIDVHGVHGEVTEACEEVGWRTEVGSSNESEGYAEKFSYAYRA